MNQLIAHIEFLLHKHNCVIVPDLGGFVVNTTFCQRDGIAAFDAPACELVFNRDLTYNDGLLAQSLMKTRQISFETALQEIDTAVKELKQELKSNKYVDLGDLGDFTMNDDSRFVYNPKPFIRPENFGLAKASLKPVIQIQPTMQGEAQKQNDRKAIIRYLTGSVAAVVIFVLMLIFPLNTDMHRQNAHLGTPDNPFGTAKTENRASETITPSVSDNGEAMQPATPDVGIPETNATVSRASTQKYFVVVGVYQVPKVAQSMVEQLKSEGFSNILTLEQKDRLDVCADSFDTLEEAIDFLRTLRTRFPHHADAWVFKKP